MSSIKNNHSPTFQETAKFFLSNTQLRKNIGHATHTIREKRKGVVEEMSDWDSLREAAKEIKTRVMRHLDHYLLQLEESVQKAGGIVHWAKDADEANRIITDILKQKNVNEVVKVKSMTTDEIRLNEYLAKHDILALETDLAELIVQLAGDESSHILVPAIHKNRTEIRDLFRVRLNKPELSDKPEELAEAARSYLRAKFLQAKVGISGANFGVAKTGTISVVESEGNGRMCTTLPDTLITVMGIEKIIPTWDDFEVFMQLLPRSSTAERMNPYNSFWTGVTEGDGPQEFHLVFLDNGRTKVLADEVGRQTLHCIRCSACLNVCPVYERTGGHAYHSIYPGPIGAILTPQLRGLDKKSAASLPFASSLCGACYEVCPVKIDIPKVLVHLRGKVVDKNIRKGKLTNRLDLEHLVLKVVAKTFQSVTKYERAQKFGRLSQRLFQEGDKLVNLPKALKGWTDSRDLKAIPKQTFREWWETRDD